MSQKYTPGPWKLGCDMGPWSTESENGSHSSWGIGTDRGVIAIVVTHARYDDPEFEANARLIAQAPAMVEALRGADAIIGEAMDALCGVDVCCDDEGNDTLHLLRERFRAILAQIDGEG